MSYGYTPTYPTTFNPMYGQQMPMRPPMPQPVQSPYLCRPVANEEEARAVPTDFTGATTVLIDAAHGCIYTKALSTVDGSPVFTAYRRAEPAQQAPQAPVQAVEYAPMSEVRKLSQELAELRATLQKGEFYDD